MIMQVGTYRPVGALVRHALLYTYRSAGAQILDTSAFYRHIAPLERKVKYLTDGVTSPLQENRWIFNI